MSIKKLSSFLLSLIAFVFFSPFLTSQVFAFSGSGSGTSSDPYQITTCAQLQEMKNDLSAYYQQDNDIDCTGVSFTPIGQNNAEFTGTFNGNNFAITNINITGNGQGVGFFGATKNATVQNIRLVSGSLNSSSGTYIGSIIGENTQNTTVTHVSSALTITPSSSSFAGGLIGYSSDALKLSKSYYSGTINTGAGANNVAGLIAGVNGSNLTTISDCYTSGTYSMNIPGYGAGIVAALYGSANITISNSYTSANIALGGNVSYGGIDGGVSESVVNTFSAVTVSGSTTAQNGGAFGFGGGTATGVYFDAYLAGTTNCTSGGGNPTCTVVNTGNSTQNYFKGNNTNAPMSSWDFVNTWQVNSGDYPTLRGFTSPAPITPTPTPAPSSSSSVGISMPSAPVCGDAAPTNAPDLFQMRAKGNSVTLYFAPDSGSNSSYYIGYGFDDIAQNFGTTFNYSNKGGAVSYTVNDLFPGMWYFKVRGQNGCMPGKWSGVMKVNVTQTGAHIINETNGNK